MSTQQASKVREPIHVAPRVRGVTLFVVAAPALCGVPRLPTTKVAAAAGVATCPTCKALYRERLARMMRPQ